MLLKNKVKRAIDFFFKSSYDMCMKKYLILTIFIVLFGLAAPSLANAACGKFAFGNSCSLRGSAYSGGYRSYSSNNYYQFGYNGYSNRYGGNFAFGGYNNSWYNYHW